MMREGWEYKKLGELCTSISDGSHNPPKGIDHSLYRMISSQNVFDDNLQITEDNVRYITESDHLCENKRTKLQKDVVLLTIVGTIGRSCVLKGNEGCLTLQRSVAALHPSDQIMPRYLMHCLIGNRHTLNQEAHGIAQKGIYLKQLSSLSIPLPPKSTQLAIVSELDKINELIRLKKEQLKDLDKLAQSIFYEMFGDPVENEKGWEVKKLGDVCRQITDGTHNSPTNTKNGDFKYVTAKNIKKEGIVLDNITYVDADTHHSIYSRCNPEYGDILYIKDGATTGIATINNLNEEFSLLSSVALLKLEDKIMNYYLKAVLNTPSLYNCIRTNMGGAAITRLTLVKIKAIKIPLPPLHLQHLFAHRIEQIEHQKSEVQKSITDLETLLASRMQYWFE